MNPIDWKAIADAYANGAADVEIAKLLDITLVEFYRLTEEQPAFARFVDKGRTMSQAWWYEQARKGLWDKNMNVALWNFNMKNRFGWADKTDISDTTDKDPVNLDEAKAQLQGALRKMAKSNPEIVSSIHMIKKEKGIEGES